MIFSMEKARQSSVGNRIFCTPAVKRVEFVSNGKIYMCVCVCVIGRWCNIFVLNAQASSEEK